MHMVQWFAGFTLLAKPADRLRMDEWLTQSKMQKQA